MKLDTQDLAISRIVDRCDGVEDWERLEALDDADIWRRVGLAMRDDAALRHGVGELVERARGLPIPIEFQPTRTRTRKRAYMIAAAAALLAVIAIGIRARSPERASIAPVDESTTVSAKAQEPRVLRQLAPVLIEKRPTLDGKGVELIYIRRAIESRVVDSTQRLGRDESGKLTASAVEPASFRSVSSF